jgi:hypothetical protein
MNKTAPTGNRTDLIFRAFSDRTRLRILYLPRGLSITGILAGGKEELR